MVVTLPDPLQDSNVSVEQSMLLRRSVRSYTTEPLTLQSTAMELGVVTVGAFDDEKVVEVLNLPEDEKPLYILPVGRK